jgi:putative FmdB family regulatory protein
MPLYDYDCQQHGTFESFASMAECEVPQPCPECAALSSRIYTSVSRHHLQQPLVVWKRPDGTFAVPAQPDARKPEEYTRVECRNAFEIRGVERAINREEREKFERAQIGKEMGMEAVQSNNRSQLRDRMAHMQPHMRDFARFSIDKNNQKFRPKYSGHFEFEAMSQNASNRDPGRDREGNRVRK